MKKIFITGGRGGIIADVIDKIKDRYFIYISVHTDSELKKIEKKYSGFKNIKCLKLDLALENDLDKVKDIDLDILICNGAVMESGCLIDIPLDKIRYNFEVNFFGNLKLIKNVIQKNRDIRIIVISSLASEIPMPFDGVYSSSKAALNQMMKALRYETKLLDRKIEIALIEPGLYKTGFNEYGFEKKYDYKSEFDKDKIKKYESLILKFQKKKLSSVSNKIIKALETKRLKTVYKVPIFQSLLVKIYNIFA